MNIFRKFSITLLVCCMVSQFAYCADSSDDRSFEEVEEFIFGENAALARASVFRKRQAEYAFLALAAHGTKRDLNSFIERGFDVNMRDEEGRTPAMHAALHGNFGTLSLLQEKSADLTKVDRKGRSIVSHAHYLPNLACPEIYSKEDYMRCLSTAILTIPTKQSVKSDEICSISTDYNCKLGFKNCIDLVQSSLPETWSEDLNRLNVLINLINHSKECTFGRPGASFLATELEEVERILTSGSMRPDSERARQIFFNIVSCGNVRLFEIFLDNGFDVNMRDSEGNTLLTYAALLGNKSVLSCLIARGADLTVVNDLGKTPLFYAECLCEASHAFVQLSENPPVTRILDTSTLKSMMAGHSQSSIDAVVCQASNISLGLVKERHIYNKTVQCCELLRGESSVELEPSDVGVEAAEGDESSDSELLDAVL